MPIAFSIYGIVAYAGIASLFLMIKNQMKGTGIWKGLKYAFSCCAVWVIYLLEPLPHVAPMDKFTYPLADSAALLAMGCLSGLFLCDKEENSKGDKKFRIAIVPTIIITLSFVAGRIVQYAFFQSYSCFYSKTVETMIWVLGTGIVLSMVMQWLNANLNVKRSLIRVLLVGIVLFGVDLAFFNFFMPLVFEADIPDLIMRTGIDIIAVTLGCFSLSEMIDR